MRTVLRQAPARDQRCPSGWYSAPHGCCPPYRRPRGLLFGPLTRGGVGEVAAEELVGHEKLPTLRRQLRDRHPRKDRVVVEQHPQQDHLERLRHPCGGEHHEPVAEPADRPPQPEGTNRGRFV
jgi:hypothetical protein